MQVFKNYDEVLDAILTSYEYNYSDAYLIKVYEDVKNRLQNGPYRVPTEEAHIINGILTLLYGDYGTSPRYGWIENKLLIPEFIKILDEHIDELKENIELIDEYLQEEE